jgi:hypothetical protein
MKYKVRFNHEHLSTMKFVLTMHKQLNEHYYVSLINCLPLRDGEILEALDNFSPLMEELNEHDFYSEEDMKFIISTMQNLNYDMVFEYKEIRFLMNLLDSFSRWCMGQFCDLLEVKGFHLTDEFKVNFRHLLSFHSINSINGYTSFLGIGNDMVSEIAKDSFDIYQVMRYRASWDMAIQEGLTDGKTRDWKTMIYVYYDEPFKTSKNEFIQIEQIKEL